jgi:hypothetical protein
VSADLDANNDHHADAVQSAMIGWVEGSVLTVQAPVPSPSSDGNTQWSVEPDRAWYEHHAHCRPAVGLELLATARAGLVRGAPEQQLAGSDRDLCIDPLVVSYLNIGFHKLERSLGEIVQVILCHRPDVMSCSQQDWATADGELSGGRVVHVDNGCEFSMPRDGRFRPNAATC